MGNVSVPREEIVIEVLMQNYRITEIQKST
jgi:hypothetical protein